MAPGVLGQGVGPHKDGPGTDVIRSCVPICVVGNCWNLCIEITLFSFLQIFYFFMDWESPHHRTKHGTKIPIVYVWFHLKLQTLRKLSDR